MEYGHFDDLRREFVITRPDTPFPWINYLGSEDFFSLFSNTAGGYSFFRDARLMRLTRFRYNNVPAGAGGHYLYVNDGGSVWSPGWMPVKAGLDRYECRHGLGYSVITGEKDGLEVIQTAMVPRGHAAEVTRVALRNLSREKKRISLFSFVEFCLWDAHDDATNFQRNLSCGEVEVDGSAIYHKTEYRERRNHYAVYWVNAPIDGFDTDRESFTGTCRGFDAPAAVVEDAPRNSVASGWSPIASHCLRRELEPGEGASFVFVLGYCENPPGRKFETPGVVNKEPAGELVSRFETDAQFTHAMERLAGYWEELLGAFSAVTGDERVDRMVNVWNQYQCMVTFNLSRSASFFESGIGRGMGFRDSAQDLLGFVHLVPERARRRILDLAATQLPDGSCYHQYQPLTRRGNAEAGSGFNDDPLWLIAGVAAYVRETGDTAILGEQVPYDNDPALSAPLSDHLSRAFRHVRGHLGPHGLPLIGHADWNDCLNLNCFSTEPGESFQRTVSRESGVAESVFIAGLFVYVADDYRTLCERAGLEGEAAFAREEKARMTQAVLNHGWDGRWFLRAYDARGEKVGGSGCPEGRIFIEPQGLCAMAGIGLREGLAASALDSVRELLLTEKGFALLAPPYTVYSPALGEISSYPPGYKENGSVFCHTNPWIVCAEAALGRCEEAFDAYRRTCPAFIPDQGLHRVEPYVYSQTIAGPGAPRLGEAKNSWLTGAAAWSFFSVSQMILGIRPDYDGLRVDPCLPSSFKDVRVRRRFRGCEYDIRIINRSEGRKGKLSLELDGCAVKGNLLPAPQEAGKGFRVTAVID